MPKIECECAFCGAKLMRYEKNPHGKIIDNHFCNNDCKGAWQRKQREDLGYTKEWLYEQYVTKGRTANDIAREVGRDSKRVWEWIHDYGIETRKRGFGDKERWFKKGHKMNVGKKLSKETREKIRQARLRDGRVPYLVNGEHWLKAYGAHPASWKGGISPERQRVYGTKEWKETEKYVRERENDTCQLCGRKQWSDERKFDIHHIYPFKDYPLLRTEPDNCVLLCHKCHMFVHSKKNTEHKFMLIEAELPEWLVGTSETQTGGTT